MSGFKVDAMPSSASRAVITKTAGITTTSQIIAEANPLRVGLIIWNPTGNSVYISYSDECTGATETDIIKTQTTWVMPAPIYTGVISCKRNSGSGGVNVTELLR
jgi:hypothetical protein